MGREAREAVRRRVSADELRSRRLFVATPMYGGMCCGQYAKACMDLQALCAKHGIQVSFCYLYNSSVITHARNQLVEQFYRTDSTHLLFIDADMLFDPHDVLTMLALDRPILAGPYSKKTIRWDRVHAAARRGVDPDQLRHFGGDPTFTVLPGTTAIDGLTPLEWAGTGFMMIRRDVFDALRTAHPDRSYLPTAPDDRDRSNVELPPSRGGHLFFDAPISQRAYLGEDVWFCGECRTLGIPILLCPWMTIEHVGAYRFSGSFSVSAAAQPDHSAIPRAMDAGDCHGQLDREESGVRR